MRAWKSIKYSCKSKQIFSLLWERSYCSEHQANDLKRQLDLLEKTQVILDSGTLWSLLWACLNSRALTEARRVHALVRTGSNAELELSKQLVQMYLKCGSLGDARELVDRLSMGDVITWTRMIAAYVQKGDCRGAMRVYQELLAQGVSPNKITIVTLLNGCVDQNFVPDMAQMEENVGEMGFITDVVIATVLMSLYSKQGRVEEALESFHRIRKLDVVAWNAMIWVYAHNQLRDEALELFHQMQLDGASPTKVSFLAVFHALGAPGNSEPSRRMHRFLELSGVERDLALSNALLDMYGKSGCLREAEMVFGSMKEFDIISWTALLAAYAEAGETTGAMETLQCMQLQGVQPNKVTLLTVLDTGELLFTPSQAEQVYGYVVESGGDSDVVMATAAVCMFGRSGSVDRAREALARAEQKDGVLWTVLMAANVDNGLLSEGVKLGCEMQLEGYRPSISTFLILLESLGKLKQLEQGKRIHRLFSEDHTLFMNVTVANSILTMYVRCGAAAAAEDWFREILAADLHDQSSFNVMIAAAGDCSQAMVMLQEMQQQGVSPSRVTLLALINVCSSRSASLSQASRVHSCVQDLIGFDDDGESRRWIGNALVDMYSKCGSVDRAGRVFVNLDTQQIDDEVSWNALIVGNSQHGNVEHGVELMRRMQLQGWNPTGITLVGLLSGFSSRGYIYEGCALFGSMLGDFALVPGAQHRACITDLLSRMGWIEAAHEFITKCCAGEDDGAAAWLTLLASCKLHGDLARGEFAANQLLQMDPQSCAGHVILSNLLSSSKQSSLL